MNTKFNHNLLVAAITLLALFIGSIPAFGGEVAVAMDQVTTQESNMPRDGTIVNRWASPTGGVWEFSQTLIEKTPWPGLKYERHTIWLPFRTPTYWISPQYGEYLMKVAAPADMKAVVEAPKPAPVPTTQPSAVASAWYKPWTWGA